MSNKIVEIQNVTKSFVMESETVHALKGISFSIEEGEFITIMGSSGSGKTTLLNILGCLDKPSDGDYILDGVNVKTLSHNELAHLRNTKIGFVFQTYNLLARTSVLENVELPLLYNASVSSGERHIRVRKALKQVMLEDRMQHLPNQLSGGQQQRVAIARALVNEPVIVLADEATGNLDTKSSYEIMMLLQDLNREQGRTLIFVTHEADIAAFSNRTIVLKDGRIIRDTKNENVRLAREALAAMPIND